MSTHYTFPFVRSSPRHHKVRSTSSNEETSTTSSASFSSKDRLRKTVSFKPSTEIEPSFDEGDEENDAVKDNKIIESGDGVKQEELLPDHQQQQYSPITTTNSSSPSRSSSLMSPKRKVLHYLYTKEDLY